MEREGEEKGKEEEEERGGEEVEEEEGAMGEKVGEDVRSKK